MEYREMNNSNNTMSPSPSRSDIVEWENFAYDNILDESI
jgi:hypothetical protein